MSDDYDIFEFTTDEESLPSSPYQEYASLYTSNYSTSNYTTSAYNSIQPTSSQLIVPTASPLINFSSLSTSPLDDDLSPLATYTSENQLLYECCICKSTNVNHNCNEPRTNEASLDFNNQLIQSNYRKWLYMSN